MTEKTFLRYLEDNASLLSGAIAFYTILSMAPVLLIASWLAGLVFGQEHSRRAIAQRLGTVLDEKAVGFVQSMIESARPESGSYWSLAAAGLLLLYAASRVFVKFQEALNMVWDVRGKPRTSLRGKVGNLLRKRLLSFGMILLVGLMLLTSILSKTLLAALTHLAVDLLPRGIWLIRGLEMVASFGIAVVTFALVYRILPDVKIPWSTVWAGAVGTALLFTIGSVAISTYLGYARHASLPGAAEALIAILLWVYYSANVVFLGAEFTHVYADERGQGIEPEEHAERVPRRAPVEPRSAA